MNRRILLLLFSLTMFIKTWAQITDVELQLTRQTATEMKTLNNGNSIFDFKLDAFGQLEITVTAMTNNDTLILHLGECKRNDSVDRTPGGSRRYRAIKVPLQKGTHTYHPNIPHDRRNTGKSAIKMPPKVGEVMPFRYCEVENCPSPLKITDVVRIAVNAPFDDNAAYFHSNDSILNAVWELCKYSIKATSFTGYYVDGDRERIPYEADALINQLSHYGVDNRYDMAQRTFAYLIDHPTWPTEWILQMVLIAWYDYLYSGNTGLITQYKDDLMAHTLIALRDSETGLITTRRGQSKEVLDAINRSKAINDIVDWPHSGTLGLDKGKGGEDDGYVYTDFNTVVNAYHYAAVNKLSQMFKSLGYQSDSEQLSAYAEQFYKDFNRAFLDKERGIYVDGIGTKHASLHANMFATVFGLVPKRYKASVAQHIISKGMACSVYGSQFLLDALYDLNEPDAALALMTSQTERSWVNMMREGSTITMEAWGNKWKPNQDWNHAWGAAPANIIPFRLMGVRPLSPAFEVVEIRPCPGRLTQAECRVPTPKGPITIILNKERMSISLPEGIKAKVYLPKEGGRSHKRIGGFITGERSWKLNQDSTLDCNLHVSAYRNNQS